MTELLKLKYVYVILFCFIVLILVSSEKIHADQQIRILADEMKADDRNERIEAQGKAIAIDSTGLKLQSDKLIYNNIEETIITEGNVIFNDLDGNTYFFDKVTSDKEMQNLSGKNPKARLEDGSRAVGSNLIKKNNITKINNAEYTPCDKNDYLIKNCPGWKLKSKSIYQDSDTKTIHYDHARIHLFNIPVLYLPYFSHPDPSVNKRSGFLMPTVESDQNLGNSFQIPIFFNIRSNLDLTFTPTIQSKSNDFYSINYRQLNDYGKFNIDASMDDNDDESGSSHHFFLDSAINNSYGSMSAYIQTTNNDTYMRKNKINKLTVLESGLSFERDDMNNYFSIDTIGYKHLAIQNGRQWEYIYPRIRYNINDIDYNILNGSLSVNNQFDFNKSLDESYTTMASSQLNWNKNIVDKSYGLVFENQANMRIVSITTDKKNGEKDDNNIRFYPQVNSVITYPLIKSSNNISQTLSPIIMPILAPYNNYTDAQSISSSNLFSSNRATSIKEWESGPRLNYGIDWFINNNNNTNFKLTLGQSLRVNKSKSDTSEELSDYFLSSNLDINNSYISNAIVLDRKDIDVKSISMNSYTEINNLKLKVDYDYTSGKYLSTNEQVALGGEYDFNNNFFLRFTGTKDIDRNKNIGYQYGLLYEDNCLGIDFNYYRDLTIDRDIVESDGYSFTIVLKPFGSTRNYGKSKIFGPVIN